MKKLLLLFILIASMQTLIMAQSSTRQKLTLQSISSIGMLNGSSGAGYSIQSILGAAVYRSFAGLGIGIDQYNLRSIPLFVDLRQELGGKLRNIFFYGDAGYNYGWLTDNQKSKLTQYDPHGFNGGLYYDAGLGYAIKCKTDGALLFSAGYSYKELHNKLGYRLCNLTSCTITNDTYTYRMPRIILKAGWRF